MNYLNQTFTAPQTAQSGDSYVGCTFQDITGNAITIADGSTNVMVQGCTFLRISGTGIYGWPGDNCHCNDNKFDSVNEPIHLNAGKGNTGGQFNGNIITHATRIGIELQEPWNNATVNENHISAWLPHLDANGLDSHMALSIAVGGWNQNDPNNPTPGRFYPGGRNVEIAHNVLIQDGPAASNNLPAKFAIELMGGNVSVHDNYIKGWAAGILLGNDGPVTVANNVFIGDSVYGDETNENTGWTEPKVTDGGGNQHFAANDPNAPAPPSTTLTPPTVVTPPPQPPDTSTMSTPAPTNVKIASQGSNLQVSWQTPAGAAGATPKLYLVAGNESKELDAAPGDTSRVVTGIPDSYVIGASVSLSLNGGESSKVASTPAMVQVFGGAAGFNPTLVPVAPVAPPPPPAPTVVRTITITVLSDGTSKVTG